MKMRFLKRRWRLRLDRVGNGSGRLVEKEERVRCSILTCLPEATASILSWIILFSSLEQLNTSRYTPY